MPAATARPRASFDPARVERELLERSQQLLERALALGADEAEVCAAGWRSISVRFEKGDLKLAQVDQSSTLGLRVFRDKRLGFASTNQAGAAAAEACARDALALAALSPPDPHNVLPDARPIQAGRSLLDEAVADVSVDRVLRAGQDLVLRSKADPRLAIDSASMDASALARAVVTSRGIRASESDAQIGCSVFGMAVDGADVGGFHYAGDSVRSLAGVDAAVEAAAREFSLVSLGNLGARAARSYTGPVLFAPDALLEIFVSPVLSAASAIGVQRGRSPLAGKIGSAIASPSITIHDDASDRTLAGASAFDREGQPCGRFGIVEQGQLASYLYNGYAAAVEGRASTGHAAGSPRSVPGLSTHAVSVLGGTGGGRRELERALGSGLYVQRFSGTVDPASGDFSGVAKSARWIEGGEVAYPVKETLIGGNVFDLLKRVIALSSKAERCSGEARAPYALLDAVAVTAG
ncbi:MAG: TldD/PmbA family protein [Planctomycetota bacterium]